MLKILVCFKIVPDIDTITNEEWIKISKNESLDYAKKIFSSYDEAALETALKIMDDAKNMDIEFELTALTIASKKLRIDKFSKNLYAVNFDKVVKINHEKNLDFSPVKISELIAEYVENNEKFNAILMGKQDNVGDHGIVPAYTAEMLNYIYIPHTIDIKLTERGFLSENMTSNSKNTQLVEKPAIYALDNMKNTYLRIATLREKLATKNKETIKIVKNSFDDIKQPLNLYREENERECSFIKGESIKIKADKLFNNYLKDLI